MSVSISVSFRSAFQRSAAIWYLPVWTTTLCAVDRRTIVAGSAQRWISSVGLAVASGTEVVKMLVSSSTVLGPTEKIYPNMACVCPISMVEEGPLSHRGDMCMPNRTRHVKNPGFIGVDWSIFFPAATMYTYKVLYDTSFLLRVFFFPFSRVFSSLLLLSNSLSPGPLFFFVFSSFAFTPSSPFVRTSFTLFFINYSCCFASRERPRRHRRPPF